MIDITKVRGDTPGCTDLIHFNNAGASLMPTPVYKAMTSHLELEQSMGGYEAQKFAEEDISAFYSEFADLLNASPEEIAFVECMDTGQPLRFMSKAALRGAENYRFFADRR